MNWFTIVMFSVMIGVRIIQHLLSVKENKVSAKNLSNANIKEAERLISKREIRTDLIEFEEFRFWDLMDQIHVRSGASFKNSLGVFRDLIRKFSAQELIQLDNLLYRLFRENLSYDIYAASTIIFRTESLLASKLLMDLLMTRGEVFFKNACINPNLIVGKEFTDITDNDFRNVIFDIYYKKSKTFIPFIEEDNIYSMEMSGNPWTEEELPNRYPELWFAFVEVDGLE